MAKETVFLKYIPHGANGKFFFKPSDEARLAFRKKMFGEQLTPEFVVLYNNRNIRRKMTGDVVLAFRKFVLDLTETQRKGCVLVLHTQPVDENGTDLVALVRDCAPEIQVVFSSDRVDTPTLNLIYANSDVVINLANAEGFGLGTLEALMAEKMIIANVTGGLQDQMGFRDDEDNLLNEDIHYNAKFGSNHQGTYRTHGEWVVPVFPKTSTLIGSPPTPYIYEDHADWREAASALRFVYDLDPIERDRRGKLGREYVLNNNFTAERMGQGFIDGIDTVFSQWKPRERFVMVKA
jgi:glycosyltransferase involved in cell wall biosynthesis